MPKHAGYLLQCQAYRQLNFPGYYLSLPPRQDLTGFDTSKKSCEEGDDSHEKPQNVSFADSNQHYEMFSLNLVGFANKNHQLP